MLEFDHVTFRYAKNMPVVLSDTSLKFGKGEFIAITGRNGSGKTTITRLLTGLEKPTEGRVLYEGKDITKEEASERSRFIGYVFQQPDRQMFMPTVREEIALGPYHQGKRGEELNRMVEKAMMETDTTALAEAYPRTLSRGDQQRVAIASALAMDTEYLILDEPTSGQDGHINLSMLSINRLPHNAITAETRLAPLSRDCCASMPETPPLSAQHSRESGAQRVSGASLDECAAGCEAVEHTGFGDGQHQIPGHHAADKHAAGDLGNHVHNATRADE